MAGLALETGSQRLELPPPAPEKLDATEATARRVAAEEGVRYLDVEATRALMTHAESENVYLIDVRSREEYAQGHVPGFRWLPGGQAVQQADSYVGVRNGTIVFACDGCVRASMTASWFRGLGYPNVNVLDGGTQAWRAAGLSLDTGLPEARPAAYDAARSGSTLVSPVDLQARLAGDAAPTVIFVGSSAEFSSGHVAGARWLPRGWLELRVDEIAPGRASPLAVTCADGLSSVLAAATLKTLGYADVAVLEGGMAAWRDAGLPLEPGLNGVAAPLDDLLPPPTYADMMNYLRWEEELGEKYKA